MTAAIRIADLHKSFQGVEVLKGVDLEVGQGEIFALLGSNGAGKTTTIKICATLLKPDSGQVRVCGHDPLRQADAVRAAISLTGQFAAVDELLTGRENLVLIARLRGLDDPAGLAARLLARFGLTEAADRRAATYSGGMTRRLDIAMGLIGDPDVVFLDEPTTGLDPEARLEVWSTVRELAEAGTTVLLTTQYLDEAEQLADRIAILHQGKIIATGTMPELKRLFPPARVEYVEKEPSLEDIFLAITSGPSAKGRDPLASPTTPQPAPSPASPIKEARR